MASPKIKNKATTKKDVYTEGHILVLRLYPTAQETKITLAETKKLFLPHLQKHPVIRIKELRNEGILVELAQKSSISEITEIINTHMKKTIKVLGNKSRAPQFIIKGIAPEYTHENQIR